MTKEQRDELKNLFLDLLPKDGSAVGNITLSPRFLKRATKTISGLTEADYWDIRNELLDEGRVGLGKGKGGSVFLVTAEAPPDAKIDEARPYQKEADLYEPFYKTISTTWVRQSNIKSFVAEITANQGSRITGGAWTRPDVTVVAVGRYAFIPGKVLDVITFEIKPLDDFSIVGLFEAAAHSAFAHRSILAIHVSELSSSSPDLERLKSEARRMGVGILLFADPCDWSTFETMVEAERREPDPANTNLFITNQISRDRQVELLELLK